MNNVKMKDFPVKTLQQVSALIDRRVKNIRVVDLVHRTIEQNEELDNMLTFQTQIEHAIQLLSREQKVFES